MSHNCHNSSHKVHITVTQLSHSRFNLDFIPSAIKQIGKTRKGALCLLIKIIMKPLLAGNLEGYNIAILIGVR